MFIDPNIGDSINISGRQYAFAETPGAPGVIYAEIGRKAKVYRLICDHQPFALKAFKPKYRIPETVENSSHIARLQGVDGLAVAQRHILTPIDNPDVVRFNEAFAYSVLMPWVEGYSWFNYITGRLPLEPAHSLRLARAFIHSVWQLEQRDLAHCDLSSSNFIFSPDFLHVELIDIEDMFGIGLIPPKEKPKGTGGYAPAWIKTDGVWEAAGDRFSAGILVSEILAWQFADVRAASNGDAYFAEDEFGHKSARFHLMGQRLAQIHPELSRLFKTVWYAESLEECPRISDWKRVLDAIQEPSLEVDPDFLELGTLDLRTKPAAPLHASFTIGNVGGGLLEGRIISNVSWLAVRPSQFSCPAGTVTDHEVISIAKPPHSKSQKHYTLTNAISVQSNQRVQMLSGTYSIIAPLVSPLQWLLRAGAFLVLMIGAYFITHPQPQPQPSATITPQPSSTLTATAALTTEQPTALPSPSQIALLSNVPASIATPVCESPYLGVTIITYGQKAASVISGPSGGAYTRWAFCGAAGDVLDISVTRTILQGVAGCKNTALSQYGMYLYDSDGNTVGSSNDGGRTFKITGFTLPRTGLFYVEPWYFGNGMGCYQAVISIEKHGSG